MASANPSTSLPDALEPELGRVLEYWKGLLRSENPMPFSDDLDLSKLPDLSSQLMLLTVFDDPQRFRFETAGDAVVRLYGSPLAGEFSDELAQTGMFENFTEQCRMTVNRRAPTYARLQSPNGARLLLPTWGEGHVHLLLGAISTSS